MTYVGDSKMMSKTAFSEFVVQNIKLWDESTVVKLIKKIWILMNQIGSFGTI